VNISSLVFPFQPIISFACYFNFQIQPELLSTDPAAIGKVNVKTLQEKMEEKAKQLVRLSLMYAAR
jgi:hypothetical protein